MIEIVTSEAGLARVRDGATVIPGDQVILRLEGPGAVTCLQGLLTNDVERPGPGSLVYGALLTPKGMIVLDLWSLRDSAGFTLLVPASARETALALFRKSIPPRLAQVHDQSETHATAWIRGPMAPVGPDTMWLAEVQEWGAAGIRKVGGIPVTVATGTTPAWFHRVVVGPRGAVTEAIRSLAATGAAIGGADDLHIARLLAGFPALGVEITDRTLPQEVRFDDIGGVSYTKGCYTGQETVARLHFRGHPNRGLVGLEVLEPGPLEDDRVFAGDREVGRIGTVVRTPARQAALAVIRREVSLGDRVIAGGRPARVWALPFAALPGD